MEIMMEAIVICDGFCPSKQRVVSVLEALQKELPDLRICIAGREEVRLLRQKHQIRIFPSVLWQGQVLTGFPNREDYLKLL